MLIGNVIAGLTKESEVSFLIHEVDGQISIDANLALDEVNSHALLKTIRSKDKDGVYYYKVNYKHLRIKPLLSGINRIENLDNFHRYCQERILNFRGRNISYLAETLQELAYRYNHRNEDIFDLLINKIIL